MMNSTSGNLIMPVIEGTPLNDVFAEIDRIRSENKPIKEISVRKKGKKWDCVVHGYSCNECGSYTPCLHKTKEEAERHNKEYYDFINGPCEECGDGTLVCHCSLLYHRLPKMKGWNIKNKGGVK